MPKRSNNVPSGPPKKRRRNKRKHVCRVNLGKERKLTPKETSNDLESITAQTATNLKAFRFLFGTHEEETEEEFIGYNHKESMSIRTTFKWRRRKLNDEIAQLESDALPNVTGESKTQLLRATLSQGSPLPLQVSPSVKCPAEVKLKDVIAIPIASPAQPLPSSSSDLKFIGFLDSDGLKATCHTKSHHLFKCCEELRLEMIDEHVGENNCLVSSISPVGERQDVTTINGVNVISLPKVISKRRLSKRNTRKPGRKSKSSSNTPSMNLKDFVQAQSIAEITVTPILQSDIPNTKAVKMHESPILISCLRKT